MHAIAIAIANWLHSSAIFFYICYGAKLTDTSAAFSTANPMQFVAFHSFIAFHFLNPHVENPMLSSTRIVSPHDASITSFWQLLIETQTKKIYGNACSTMDYGQNPNISINGNSRIKKEKMDLFPSR